MKEYDYKKAMDYINENKDVIKSASLGMREDWFWTSNVAFEDGEFKLNLEDEKLLIGGINGSSWATPSLGITNNDDEEKFIDCFVGESSKEKPLYFELGCLSLPCQDEIDKIEVSKE